MVSKKSLTKKQEEIVNKKGLFVVKARPGSGKTFAVAARFAKLLKDWKHSHQGIAAISFTNAAWQEIEKYLREDFGVKTPISYPHFLGSIDSFLNKYIFLPFGYLVMGCNKRVQLIGPPFNNWEPIGNGYYWRNAKCNLMCKLNQFSYDINGDLINLKFPKIFNKCALSPKPCNINKAQINKSGYATLNDSRYFSMKVLRQFAQITMPLVYRFPMLIMDEAQDTSDIEMKILDMLIEKGLIETMLIGDPEQGIFEWRNARPDLLEKKHQQWHDNSLTLNENWRSSQIICNFFNKISGSDHAPVAVNENVNNFTFIPQVWEYSENEFQDTISQFIDLCQKQKITLSHENIAILARSSDIAKSIKSPQKTSDKDPWNDEITLKFCNSKFLFDCKQFKPAFSMFEKIICQILKNHEKQQIQNYCSAEDLEKTISKCGFVNWRKKIYLLLKHLPATDCSLKEWVDKVNTLIHRVPLLCNTQLVIKRRKEYQNMQFAEAFSEEKEQADYYIGTIHSVKGKTFDSVLVFFKKSDANNHKYKQVLDDIPVNNEELRNVYVSITRPRKVLVIAVPKGEASVWKNKFGIY